MQSEDDILIRKVFKSDGIREKYSKHVKIINIFSELVPQTKKKKSSDVTDNENEEINYKTIDKCKYKCLICNKINTAHLKTTSHFRQHLKVNHFKVT